MARIVAVEVPTLFILLPQIKYVTVLRRQLQADKPFAVEPIIDLSQIQEKAYTGLTSLDLGYARHRTDKRGQ